MVRLKRNLDKIGSYELYGQYVYSHPFKMIAMYSKSKKYEDDYKRMITRVMKRLPNFKYSFTTILRAYDNYAMALSILMVEYGWLEFPETLKKCFSFAHVDEFCFKEIKEFVKS